MPLVTDLTPPSGPEGFILDPNSANPLNLGDLGSLRLAALTIPPAPKRPEWATNADTDGAALVRYPLHDDRACSMQVRVRAVTMDQATTAVGVLVSKLEEACRLGANGGAGMPFLWTPVGATTGLTGYMKFGQITDMPVTYADGWFAAQPILTVQFTAAPFLYGAEVTGPSATGTDPLLTLTVPDVPGDVAAEARLVVTDGSTEARRWVEWGVEQRYFDAASPAPLFIDSASLVTTGYAGAQAALTGAYGGTAISADLFSQPTAVCGLGDLAHVGSFRVKARVYATSAAEYWRPVWQQGDGYLSANGYVQPIAAGFNELDLGIVTIEEALAGAQSWSGRLEAYTTTSGGETGEVDYLILYPIDEGYGRIEAAYNYQSGAISEWDDFNGATAGTALGGRVAPTGGTWATSGVSTDFAADSGGTVFQRSTSNDAGAYRYAILGSTSFDDVETSVRVNIAGGVPPISPGIVVDSLAIARWTDSSNHLRLRLFYWQLGTSVLYLEQLVGGTRQVLAQVNLGSYGGQNNFPTDAWYALRLIAYASGRAFAALLDGNGNEVTTLDAISSDLATGGTLATGLVGFADSAPSSDGPYSTTRSYDDFYASIPTSEPLVIRGGEAVQITSKANLRQSADGTTYGDLPSRGSRLFIPPAGTANRTTRIAVRATREDPVTMASRNAGDSLTAQLFYTPRYLAVPRS